LTGRNAPRGAIRRVERGTTIGRPLPAETFEEQQSRNVGKTGSRLLLEALEREHPDGCPHPDVEVRHG
jgi:hypothetical protein